MRILHFYKTFYPNTTGGVEQVIYQLARGMVQRGLEVDVLSLSAAPGEHSIVHSDGYNSHTVQQQLEIASMGCSLAVFKRFASLAKHADIVHYHFPWPWMDLVHFATRPKCRTIVSYHSDIVRQRYALKVYTPLMHKFLNNVDTIIATSPNYCQSSKVLQKFSDKTQVIPLGLDRATYTSPTIDILNKWREQFKQPFFLFVGVLRYYKGLHILLEAVKTLPYTIVIAGTGPCDMALKQQAVQNNLHNVYFLGKVSEEDKAALFTLCYAVVFPSHLRSEAFGLSLLEGAMFGKPMISCEIGTGTSFINQHGITGLTVEPANPEALNKAMRFLITHPEEAKLMGQNAAQRYQTVFTGEKMVDATLEVYNNRNNS